MSGEMTVDWDALVEEAVAAARRAHAPYSGLHVGAAGLADDGRMVVGCNVENASYGLTLCAECGLVSALHASGGGRLVAVVVRSGKGDPLMPCGRCRQLLFEAGGPDLLVGGDGSPRPIADLLPGAFGPDDLGA
jgi:cytidine deaminase